jgi:hypothetical protein
LPPKGREIPMNLTRLAYTQHPRPPQSELRQRGVFDSGARLIGQVMHIYVVDRHFRFIGVAMRKGFVSFGKKHHLVPIEAIAEAEPDSITLKVDQQAVESAPTLDDPHAAPDERLQRAAREHCGLAAVPSEAWQQ